MNNIIKAALIQRQIPHYRVPFFTKLHKNSNYSWTFLAGPHGGSGASGLCPLDLDDIPSEKIKPISFAGGRVVFESGLLRRLRYNDYRVVVFELGWQIISNIMLLAWARWNNVAAIGWSKGIADNGKPRSFWRRVYEKVLTNQCAALLVYGEISKNYFAGLHYDRKKIFTAQNTVDVTRIIKNIHKSFEASQALKSSWGYESHTVVGYFGRLSRVKRVDEIISAFDAARNNGIEAKLVIAGDGPEKDNLIRYANSVPNKNDIRFAGRVPVGDEGKYFQMFDLIISGRSPGLSILEAMANAKPVLILPEEVPETELIRDLETGYVAGGFSTRDLALGLQKALADTQKMREIGRKAQLAVNQCATQELMVKAFDSAVSYALNQTSG